MLSTQEASIECQRAELQQLRQLISERSSEGEQLQSAKEMMVENKRLSGGLEVKNTHLHNVMVMTTSS